MAALPLTQKGLDVSLPSQPQGPARPDPTQIVVRYSADRQLTINRPGAEKKRADPVGPPFDED